MPDSSGGVSWFWQPAATGSATVKLIITDSNNNQSNQEFSVLVNLPDQTNAATGSTAGGGTSGKPKNSSGIGAVFRTIQGSLSGIYSGSKNAINALPPQVVYSFPYILLVLLVINLLILIAQTSREIREYRTLERLLERNRELAESKKSLLQLVAHYLRTPLTYVSMGTDILQKSQPSVSTDNLSAQVNRVNQKINELIDHSRVNHANIVQGDGIISMGSIRLWRQPGLFLPVLLIGAVSLTFNILTNHTQKYTIGQVNQLTQLFVFFILSILIYQMFRSRDLRRRDRKNLQRIADEENAERLENDRYVGTIVSGLNEELVRLSSATSNLGNSKAAQNIQNGNNLLRGLMDKLSIATVLKGAQTDQPFAPATLSVLVESVKQKLTKELSANNISINIKNEAVFSTQEIELLSFVLQSLLDNAIAYSKPGSSIDIDAVANPIETIITVKDYGKGVPEQKLGLLFQPFSRVEGAMDFNHQGMGFSLYLDKIIMEYLGGSIEFESQPGKGATVTLHLPGIDSSAVKHPTSKVKAYDFINWRRPDSAKLSLST